MKSKGTTVQYLANNCSLADISCLQKFHLRHSSVFTYDSCNICDFMILWQSESFVTTSQGLDCWWVPPLWPHFCCDIASFFFLLAKLRRTLPCTRIAFPMQASPAAHSSIPAKQVTNVPFPGDPPHRSWQTPVCLSSQNKVNVLPFCTLQWKVSLITATFTTTPHESFHLQKLLEWQLLFNFTRTF